MENNKLAIFYSGYLPGEKYGGPVTSLYNLTELIGNDVSLYIICLDHDLKEKKRYSNISDGWNRIGKARVKYLSDKDFNESHFSEIIDEISPNLLYVSSIFSASHVLPALSLSRKKRIPVLLAPRGELNTNALRKKSLKKWIYLTLLKVGNKLKETHFQATSNEELKNIVESLHVKQSRVFLLPNIPTAYVPKKNISKNENEIKLCFVGRIVKNKNLHIALKAVTGCKNRVCFDIYGPIEDTIYWDECRALMDSVGDNIIITYKGALKPAEMRETYSQYDCLISPTEFENYGQSIVEAMLHDVPVIVSKGTTPWDEIADAKAGFVVPIDQINEFSLAIDSIAGMNCEKYGELVNNLRIYCSLKFDFESLKRQYLEVISKIIDKGDILL